MSVNLPVVNAPYLNVDGLQIAITGNASATVASGSARNSTNENDIILSAQATLNAASVGLNGLDTSALANTSLYAIFVVGDSSFNNPVGVLLSLSAVAPLLPVGYDMFRRLGYIRTDGSAHFLAGYWSGDRATRLFTYDVPLATAVTAGGSSSYAAVDLTGMVPPVNNLAVLVEANWTANAAADTMAIQPLNAVGDTVKTIATVAGATAHTLVRNYVQVQLLVAAPKFNYKVSAGTVALNVAGYQYSI